MSEQETQQAQGEPESYTSGGMTYAGAARSRYGKLQDAVEQFRQQADWLEGYIFIVGEHFASVGAGSVGTITGQVALSYLDAVPGVATDVSAALEEVQRLAAELRLVMAGHGEAD